MAFRPIFTRGTVEHIKSPREQTACHDQRQGVSGPKPFEQVGTPDPRAQHLAMTMHFAEGGGQRAGEQGNRQPSPCPGE